MEAQSGHNDLIGRSGKSPDFFLVATGDVSAYLHVTRRSHIYIGYHGERKNLLRRASMKKKTEIPPSSVFMGNGYVPNGRSEWQKTHCDRHHTYLTSQNHELPDAIVFAFGHRIHAQSTADALSVNKENSSEEADVDVDDSEHNSSDDNDEKNSELSDSILKTVSTAGKE